MNVDTLIVGGGISGLYLNYLIKNKNKNKNTCLIEKSSYFGGRVETFTTKFRNKKYSMEAGAGRFTNNHKRFIKLIKKFGLTNKIFELSKKVNLVVKKNKWKNSYLTNYLPYNFLDGLLKTVKLTNRMRNISFLEWLEKQVSKEICDFIKDTYPYKDIFKINAFDAISLYKSDLKINNKFYALGGGLSQIIHGLTKEIKKKKGTLMPNTECLHIQEKNNQYIVKTNMGLIHCKNLCLAIQRPHLLKLSYLKPLHSLLKSVRSAPLLRVYAIFDTKCLWFKNLPKLITDSKINYIIPINYKLGLIMISYCDEQNANYIKNLEKDKKMMPYIMSECEKLFNQKIPNPLWWQSFYWKHGVADWLPGYNSKTVSNKMIKPMKNKNLFICGENYSQQYQCWMEGSLETAENVFKKIEK